jgi:prepilin-type N-terminal cleavage/methylation domain-containing protein
MREGVKMRLRRKLGNDKGFTLVEVLIAGVILAVALIPMTEMFSVSFRGIRSASRMEEGTNCAKAAMEQIRAKPFYTAHVADETVNENWDIDDFFWGERSPINLNPNPGESPPNWKLIPEVPYYDYGKFRGFEDFRVGVQLAYLADDIGVAAMHPDWGPRIPGNDRPKDAQDNVLHLLLVKVNVYWMNAGKEDSYTQEDIVTDTQAIYNFGSKKIIVDRAPSNPESVLNPNRLNAAAHWSDPDTSINVTIEGWGFDPDTVTAHLVRNKNYDIPINLTSKTDTVLKGSVNLYNTGTDIPNEPDWYPRAAVGYWTLKIRQQNLFSSYLYNGFVVEYPQPKISAFGNTSDMSRTGVNNQTAVSITTQGGPFVNLIEAPAVRLIRTDADGQILTQVDGKVTQVTVPSGSNGYATSGCTIKADFDLTLAPAGEYRMQVVNTREPTLIGHRASDYSNDYYTVVDFRPEVSGITVDKTGGTTVYQNRGNPWAVTITGANFNQVGTPPVEIYLCSEIAGDLPAGNYVKGVVTSVPNSTTVKGTFDVSSLPLGNYMVYVKNIGNELAGWTAGTPLQVMLLTKYIDSFQPDPAFYSAFYENYYDIPSFIDGLGLDAATAVSITNGTVSYAVDEYTINSNTRIAVNLNLINCPNGSNWEVRVQLSSGESLSAPFSVVLGPAKILPPNDSKHALKIYRSGKGIVGGWSVETTTSKAQAFASSPGSKAYAKFSVLGMGFPISGTTTLKVWCGSWWSQESYATVMDRGAKTVMIVSDDWEMPRASGDGGISVQRTGDTNLDSYSNRWQLVVP